MWELPGLGWQPDVPDARDYVTQMAPIQELLRRLRGGEVEPPPEVDLREYFPAVRHQRGLDSASAQACVGMLEYFQRRACGDLALRSTLFCFQCAQKLQGSMGASGVGIRTALKAIATFGLPPDRLWADSEANRRVEPPAHLYSFTRDIDGLRYFRLDGTHTSGQRTLRDVKRFLAAGFPVAFGFAAPVSITRDPAIPFRPTVDANSGGQSALAVGYDDRRPGSERGALLIRNSWGVEWGEDGYGWLPYGYVRQQLARDFWTMIKPAWADSGELTRPAEIARAEKAMHPADVVREFQ